jgi:hypothetical protein
MSFSLSIETFINNISIIISQESQKGPLTPSQITALCLPLVKSKTVKPRTKKVNENIDLNTEEGLMKKTVVELHEIVKELNESIPRGLKKKDMVAYILSKKLYIEEVNGVYIISKNKNIDREELRECDEREEGKEGKEEIDIEEVICV